MKPEQTATLVVAGVLIASAADLVLHRDKIRRSLHGQQQHYSTKHRGPVSRLAHAVAAHTFTGRLLGRALERAPAHRS